MDGMRSESIYASVSALSMRIWVRRELLIIEFTLPKRVWNRAARLARFANTSSLSLRVVQLPRLRDRELRQSGRTLACNYMRQVPLEAPSWRGRRHLLKCRRTG